MKYIDKAVKIHKALVKCVRSDIRKALTPEKPGTAACGPDGDRHVLPEGAFCGENSGAKSAKAVNFKMVNQADVVDDIQRAASSALNCDHIEIDYHNATIIAFDSENRVLSVSPIDRRLLDGLTQNSAIKGLNVVPDAINILHQADPGHGRGEQRNDCALLKEEKL